MNEVLNPIMNVKLVDRDDLKPNDYNPNKVSKQNLDLLKESIVNNGWTMPIVIRPDNTIIDGFHRWTLAGREDMRELLGGKVPVVVVDHDGDRSKDIAGTVTHNRARGTHLLEPMKNIVKELIEEGKTVDEISKQLGMGKEEIYRLTDMSREKFLELMVDSNRYSRATYKINTRR